VTAPHPPAAGGNVVDGVDVDAVYNAVVGCPGVAGLGSWLPGAIATYLPGRRVPGVRVSPGLVELEVRTLWGSSAVQVAASIRRALARVVSDRPVDVTISDIELPDEPPAIFAPPSSGSETR
jgi:hypothetical protein